MGIEGSLQIGLVIRSQVIEEVSIRSSRPLHAARVFQGKRVDEALSLLPKLFAICGNAQACAGVRACEQALGIWVPEPLETMREILVRLETLREHLWRILLDWPGFLGESQQPHGMAGMMALQQAFRQALTAGVDPWMPFAGGEMSPLDIPASLLARLNQILEASVFAMTPASWLDMRSEKALSQWAQAGKTPAARFLDKIAQASWQGLGACRMGALPRMNRAPLVGKMSEDAFIVQPEWLGDCRETTSLTRVESPLLAVLGQAYGNGADQRHSASDDGG